MILLSGCSGKVGLQPISEDEWFTSANRSALTSKSPSEFTLRYLRREDLASAHARDPVSVIERLEKEYSLEPDRERCFVLAELFYLRARMMERDNSRIMQFYLSSLLRSYEYLFDSELKPALNIYSPCFRWACDFYNRSLAKCLIFAKENNIMVEEGEKVPLFDGEMSYAGLQNGLSWDLRELGEYDVAYNYEVKGLTNHYRRPGIGVPIILVRDLPPVEGRVPEERFLRPRHQVFAATAVLHIKKTIENPSKGQCKTEAFFHVYDTVNTSEIQVGNIRVPLELDFTTPIAYSLDRLRSVVGMVGFFWPEAWADFCGLYMIQRYEPGKIPVVFVHGLFSTPETWTVMFNELVSDPVLRSKYQMWFFLYPTGNPLPFNANLLRETLLDVRARLDPNGEDSAFDQMVLVGHSMGGLLSKMMVQDSGNALWDGMFDRPIDELDLAEDERGLLQRMLFFKPLPFVHRVIFLATPHHGSEMAENRLSQIGLFFVRLPKDIVDLFVKINPLMKEELKARSINPRINVPTGFHGLRADSGYLQTIAKLPISSDVFYHSIIGNRNSAGVCSGTDGFVPYKSAHLEGAVSEKVIKSDHNVQTSPGGILEIRRILYENLGLAQKQIRSGDG